MGENYGRANYGFINYVNYDIAFLESLALTPNFMSIQQLRQTSKIISNWPLLFWFSIFKHYFE